MRLGLGLTLAFVLLRALNVYGDPNSWTKQPSVMMTVLSFLSTHKYPPSLLFLLMTLGPAIAALGWFERVRAGRALAPLITFGRVPMFFCVTHIYLFHLAAGLTAVVTGHGTTVLTNPFIIYADPWGFGLPIVYAVWIVGAVAVWPPCRWFANVKRQRSEWWFSYL